MKASLNIQFRNEKSDREKQTGGDESIRLGEAERSTLNLMIEKDSSKTKQTKENNK